MNLLSVSKNILIVVPFLLAVSVSGADKTVSDAAIKKVEDVGNLWKKSYKYEEKTYSALQQQINLIADLSSVLNYSELESGLRASIEKLREDAFKKIEGMQEQVIPYLVQDYISTVRDRFRARDKLSRESKVALAKSSTLRFVAIEDSLNVIGVKAIPALTDLHSKASQKEAKLLTERTKELIARIVKKSDLENEKIKVQLEIGKITNSKDEAPSQELNAGGESAQPNHKSKSESKPTKASGNIFEEKQQADSVPPSTN